MENKIRRKRVQWMNTCEPGVFEIAKMSVDCVFQRMERKAINSCWNNAMNEMGFSLLSPLPHVFSILVCILVTEGVPALCIAFARAYAICTKACATWNLSFSITKHICKVLCHDTHTRIPMVRVGKAQKLRFLCCRYVFPLCSLHQ